MKNLLGIVLFLAALAALAGELPVGILTPRGASTNNKGGSGDAGFRLPAGAKLTVQCANSDGGSASTTVCINAVTCTAVGGILLTGNQALPTSSASNQVALTDGGYTALISAYSIQSDNCVIFTRQGNEF